MIAIELAGIKALPSIFNAMILISVMSVANSCTFASTRTFQALAQHGKSFQKPATSLPLTTANRHGSQVVRLRRQEGPSPCCHPASTSVRLLGVRQFGQQWWCHLQLAPSSVRSLFVLHLRQYRRSAHSLPICMVSRPTLVLILSPAPPNGAVTGNSKATASTNSPSRPLSESMALTSAPS